MSNRLLLTVVASALAIASVAVHAQPRMDVHTNNGRYSACPVSVETLRTSHNQAYIYYLNNTKSDIDDVLFDAAYYDDQDQPHHIQMWGDVSQRVHPNDSKQFAINIKFLKAAGYTGLAIWPSKIRYRDGSTSDIDAASQPCALEQRRDRLNVGVRPPMKLTSLIALNEMR